MKVGFIGIGQMGVHMSRHIRAAGYSLVVHDASKDAAAGAIKEGAEWAHSPAAVAEASRVVITCLPTPQIVEEVALGTNGLKAGWREGDIYIDMSTNSPSTVRRIAEAAAPMGVKVLDAPVSGGTKGAELGTLTIMVGGDPAVLEEARAVLEPMANKIFHLGGVGCGNVAKLVNNLIGLGCNSISAEGFVLGAKAGIALAHKDITLALGLGDEFGVSLPVAQAVERDLADAIKDGLADRGVDAVILGLEETANVQVRTGGQG
jgi:3-hydroxyisobutyrate dehydrogenase-like beta-hydroxyacid dehydrogenase